MSSRTEAITDTIDVSSMVKALKSSTDTEALKPYVAKSRWIRQSIHAFLDITRVFYSGVTNVQDSEGGAEPEYSKGEIQAFNSIMKLERGFPNLVQACSTDPSTFLALIAKVSEASSASRGDDTAKLKQRIIRFIYEDGFSANLTGNRLQLEEQKACRGWQNIETAGLLCPLRLRSDFLDDPQGFIDGILDCKIKVDSNDLPSFLYESGTLYNKDKEYLGLFRGFILARVYRQIFTGPSSALNAHGKANKTKAKTFGLKKVTPRTIAYAAVQTYVALSAMPQWGPSYGLFNLERFYDNIVETFERDPDSAWVAETLQWWNEQVPRLNQNSSVGRKCIEDMIGQPRPADRLAVQLAHTSQELVRSITPFRDAPDDPENMNMSPYDSHDEAQDHKGLKRKRLFQEAEQCQIIKRKRLQKGTITLPTEAQKTK